jgi:hypothetical protein
MTFSGSGDAAMGSARLHIALWIAVFLATSVGHAQEFKVGTAGQESLKPADETIVGIKLLKANRGTPAQPLKIFIPKDCTGCVVMHGPFYEGQNARESFFYLKVPVSSPVLKGMTVDVGDLAVRAVVVEKSYLPFHRSGNIIAFDMPIQPRNRSSTLELQTSLDWPGLTLRVEHAFEDRRAGAYAQSPWPALERQAALNLEFGLREAIRRLGLDQEVCKNALGRIHLMGFDTNSPLGHEDYPPHIHIILRWPHFAGSQAPHFYLSPVGKIAGEVRVTIDGLPEISPTIFPQGKPVPAVDYLGKIVFETVTNSDGSLSLERPDVGACMLRPVDSSVRGFANGVGITCSTSKQLTVSAEDDTNTGTLRVFVDSKLTEIYQYDLDTAVLQVSTPVLPSGSTSCNGQANN